MRLVLLLFSLLSLTHADLLLPNSYEDAVLNCANQSLSLCDPDDIFSTGERTEINDLLRSFVNRTSLDAPGAPVCSNKGITAAVTAVKNATMEELSEILSIMASSWTLDEECGNVLLIAYSASESGYVIGRNANATRYEVLTTEEVEAIFERHRDEPLHSVLLIRVIADAIASTRNFVDLLPALPAPLGLSEIPVGTASSTGLGGAAAVGAGVAGGVGVARKKEGNVFFTTAKKIGKAAWKNPAVRAKIKNFEKKLGATAKEKWREFKAQREEKKRLKEEEQRRTATHAPPTRPSAGWNSNFNPTQRPSWGAPTTPRTSSGGWFSATTRNPPNSFGWSSGTRTTQRPFNFGWSQPTTRRPSSNRGSHGITPAPTRPSTSEPKKGLRERMHDKFNRAKDKVKEKVHNAKERVKSTFGRGSSSASRERPSSGGGGSRNRERGHSAARAEVARRS